MTKHGSDIDALAGVLVWTSEDSFERMAAFYTETLGLAPRSRRHRFVNFEWGGVRLTVATHGSIAGPATDPLRLMVNFAVADIAAVHERLAADGVAFSRPPERESWGGWVATFSDPDGNVLQLLQMA